MKVSHEAPVPYMRQVRGLIDYDYCLPHLLDENEEYKQYFQESKEMQRYIIMDNSLHELGHPYDSERLAHWLYYFKPDEFIVPDYWQDKTATLVSAKEWINKTYPGNTTPIAVVQGKNKSESRECYNILKHQGYQKIAFSYGADWYYENGNKDTEWKYKDEEILEARGWYENGNEKFIHIMDHYTDYYVFCKYKEVANYYKNKVKPHEANLTQDWQKIQAATLNSKNSKILQKWFKSARQDVFISIDKDYDLCGILE